MLLLLLLRLMLLLLLLVRWLVLGLGLVGGILRRLLLLLGRLGSPVRVIVVRNLMSEAPLVLARSHVV